MSKLIRRLLIIMSLPFLMAAAYLLTALIGAIIPASSNSNQANGRALEPPVYLIGTLLHTDIAIPVNSLSLTKFEFLREAGFPLDNPELKYFVIGWGSREFYPQTSDYEDIKFSTAWIAATGDNSVMHVGPSRDLSDVEGVRKVQMTEAGFASMLEYILKGFSREADKPVLMAETYGYGDAFYESPMHFNIFIPCNTWASEALRQAGLGTGIWTPTSYSLKLAHWLHN